MKDLIINLSHVIKTKSVRNIHINSTYSDILSQFNEFKIKKYRLTRKSNIEIIDIKNITFLLNEDIVTTIQVNFETEEQVIVSDDVSDSFKNNLWDILLNDGWDKSEVLDVLKFKKDGMKLEINSETYKIHIFNITL